MSDSDLPPCIKLARWDHLSLLEVKMGWGLRSPNTLVRESGLELVSLKEVRVIEKTLTLGHPHPVPQ